MPNKSVVDLVVADYDKRFGPEFVLQRDRRNNYNFSILHRAPKDNQSWKYYFKGIISRGNSDSILADMIFSR